MVSDLWIVALTALTGYLILVKRKPCVMTPAEYEEWLIYNEDESIVSPT
jgi:hypothetical protein